VGRHQARWTHCAAQLSWRPSTFVVPFIVLCGWYFLILGMDAGFFYWIVVGDVLYLAGALVVGYALFLEVCSRRGADQI